ncbi:hypothetical protein AALB47_19365 [Lachnospiraceae bacterium 54-11]|nr:hypothetical protein [Lachnospiraceae bacterium]
MDKNSVLYLLMGMRMNSVMNGITEQDRDYQALLQEVDVHLGSLDALNLPKETMHLIDRCVSGYNAIGSRYGMLAYMLGFSDCRELLLGTARPGKEALPDGLL